MRSLGARWRRVPSVALLTLGNPIDDLGPIGAEGRRALELQAPGVTSVKSVHEPL